MRNEPHRQQNDAVRFAHHILRVAAFAFPFLGGCVTSVNNASSQDGAVLNNKLTAATTFTAHVDVLSELVAYHSGGAFNSAHTFLATVKTSVPSNATIDAAVLAAVTAGTPSAFSRAEVVTSPAIVSEGDLSVEAIALVGISAADMGG